MDRRSFLRNLGFAGASIAVAPLVSFEAPKRMVYKVDKPAFIVVTKKKGVYPIVELNTNFKSVATWRGTLKEFCDRYPKDIPIFFYEHQKLSDGNPCVRATAFRLEPDMEIVETKGYEKMYI